MHLGSVSIFSIYIYGFESTSHDLIWTFRLLSDLFKKHWIDCDMIPDVFS